MSTALIGAAVLCCCSSSSVAGAFFGGFIPNTQPWMWKTLKKLTQNKGYSIELSLSDEKNYAIANVIIYGKEK